MGFSTKKTTSSPTTTGTAPAPKRTPAAKPDYLLKIKTDDGKWARVGGMWFDAERDSYKITLDADVELKSTEDERVKINVFKNDGSTKFGNKK
jgi:hypothetical protein